MARTIVVTGAASGIGAATAALLRERGDRVIAVDLAGSDVDADLSSDDGRRVMVDAVVAATDGRIDGVVANAGTAEQSPLAVRVNFFGAVATLEGLRPLLASSEAPRAAITSSMASFQPYDETLVDACLAGDEDAAVAAAQALVDSGGEAVIYASTKQAINRWMRTVAATDDWAGAGIPINAVGPGVIETPMVEGFISTQEGRDMLAEMVPMPLGGYGRPEEVAELLAWLVSTANSKTTGQVIFIDGGSDVVLRGPTAF
jgi:NAD(P)-dependent dehydrogenase (short-subunit alcohol dehydrogenase family)